MRLVKGDIGGRIDEEASAAFGLAMADEHPVNAIDVWPENEATVRAFIAMGTQWNIRPMGGVIGLRYESLPIVLRFAGIPRPQHAAVFDGLRMMEHAAIGAING